MNTKQNHKDSNSKIIEDDKELSKEEIDELYREYKIKTKKIVEKIHSIVEERKIRNISDEKYQELFDYISEVKSKNPKFYQIQRENRKKQKLLKEKDKSTNNNNINIDYDYDDSEDELEGQKTDSNIPIEIPQEFSGYINEINQLKQKVQEDDFLQLHEPLPIEI